MRKIVLSICCLISAIIMFNIGEISNVNALNISDEIENHFNKLYEFSISRENALDDTWEDFGKIHELNILELASLQDKQLLISEDIISNMDNYVEICQAEISKNIEKNVKAREEAARLAAEKANKSKKSNTKSLYKHIDRPEWADRAIGRLTIPSLGVDTYLYWADYYNGDDSQAVVDATDSAAWLVMDGHKPLIAEHRHQSGFNNIKKAVTGVTEAYITKGESVTKYICANIDSNGINPGYGFITYSNGEIPTSCGDMNGIVMYTCNSHWSNITIVDWNLAE